MPSTVWVDTLHNVDIASGAQGFISLQSFSTGVHGGRALTLLRTIICHDYFYTVHDSGEGAQFIDVGIGIASAEAITASVVPDPATPTDVPTRGWIYRCRHVLHGFAADQATVDVRTVYRDLRGRRKLDNGGSYLVIDNTAKSGVASAISVVGITRQLFQITS